MSCEAQKIIDSTLPKEKMPELYRIEAAISNALRHRNVMHVAILCKRLDYYVSSRFDQVQRILLCLIDKAK